MQKLSHSLKENLACLQQEFGDSGDYYLHQANLCGVPCAAVLCDVVAGIKNTWFMLLRPLQESEQRFEDGKKLFEWLVKDSGLPFTSKFAQSSEQVCYLLNAGHSLLFVDGVDEALVFSTQDFALRSVSEPDSEANVYGSKEAFTDVLRKNMGLIRRRMRGGGLVMETLQLGEATQTEVAICYQKNLADPQMVDTIRKRLKEIRLQMVFDASYLAPFLESAPASLFGCTGMTQRPDTLCAKLCEGKVAVMADGSPYAVLVPYFFAEHFQCMDDYSARPYYASFIRLLKYMAFFLAVMLPGAFVSAANFTPELFPGQLLYKVAASESATPLPLFLEAIFVNILLEVVKEAGLRLPKPIGHSVSLVAALIVGDAAVRFGIIGSPVIILLALSAICGFAVPSLYQPVTILRMLFILAGGLLGPCGILLLLMALFYRVFSIDTYGMPYTAPLTPYSNGLLQDGLLRTGWLGRQGAFFTIHQFKKKGEGLHADKTPH